MGKNIVLSSDELIICPKCDHKFPLHQGITRQTIEKYESAYDETLAIERRGLEERLSKEAERKAGKAYTDQITKLTEQLAESGKATQDAKAQITKVRDEAKAKALAEHEQDKKAMSEDLAEKEAKLKIFREQEIQLRTDKKKLEEAQQNMQLELARKLDEERQKIQKQAGDAEAEKSRLKEAELRKQIDDAKKVNEDLRRKLDQGSQQLQGEVLELELENSLTAAFRLDRIEEVKKGQRGADVLQSVCTPMGQVCGKIIWETKRAENWSEKWLTKLKDDQLEAKADIAVLVTTAMPKGANEPFLLVGDVWVVDPQFVKPVAEMLRVLLLEANRLKLVNTGRSEKMELLYNYLSSPAFAQKVRTMVESFKSMRDDLESEKRAMLKIWAKRQAQIERVTTGMATVVGELQGIAQGSLAQLESIEALALPKGDLSDLDKL